MEIDTELIIRQYDANLQNYEKLARDVQSLLVKSVKRHGVKTHSITSRIKEVASFLDYKKSSTIPKQLKRDFHALSGLFYVADTHFSFLKQSQTRF